MKKLVFSILAVLGITLGASAVSGQYFGPFSASAMPSTVAPGGSVTVTVQNCDDGTPVTITLEDSSVTVTCAGTAALVQGFRAPAQTATPGTASGVVTAPTDAGAYIGTATGTSDGGPATADFSVTVQVPTSTVPQTNGAGGTTLPSTGGGGIEPLAVVAASLLVVGFGLVVVTQIRRRQSVVTN